MAIRSGMVLAHFVAFPFAVLVVVALARLYLLFRATEAGKAWRMALVAALAFFLHNSFCLASTLSGGSRVLNGFIKATGFLTLLTMGAAILLVYKSLTGERSDFSLMDDLLEVRGGETSLNSGEPKGRKKGL